MHCSVVTTNAIYHCEELEDAANVYDTIVDDNENEYATVAEETTDNVYLDVIGDETQLEDATRPPPPPTPRLQDESASEDQDHGRAYQGLEDKKPENVYLQLLGEETPQTKAADRVQDAKPQDHGSQSPNGDRNNDTKL